jgi:hypothetical protein
MTIQGKDTTTSRPRQYDNGGSASATFRVKVDDREEDLDDRVSLHPLDPENVLRALLATPPPKKD